MRSTTLFSLYALGIVVSMIALGVLSIYNLERSRWWDARAQLAQESYGLHLQLKADLFQLFKQHGDALLIGDRDGGDGERALRAQIDQNLRDIRDVIAREIQMVGEEEIEELELLDETEDVIRQVVSALARLSASGEPIETAVQIGRLSELLEREIDIHLGQLIGAALEEEREEVEEVLAEAAAFRAWNEKLTWGLLAVTLGFIAFGLLSFNTQIRKPLTRLRDGLSHLRTADYSASFVLGGSREFQDLGSVLKDMAAGLSQREAGSEEQRQVLEATVAARTAELQRMITRLEAGEENRKRLMADISHELRTPLAIILGEADVALRTGRGLDDDMSDALARIRDSARHTNQIVDDMLTVARQEAGQLRLDRRETDLRKVIRDALDMFPQSVRLEIPVEPVRLSIDEVRMRQCMIALLQNARRYGGPTIEVRLDIMPDSIGITVEDDGPGLSDDEKRSAFERFFRGSNVSGQGTEGSGLGLPVVKSIVEAHGGRVVLADADLGGLSVRIDLPTNAPLRVVGDENRRKTA